MTNIIDTSAITKALILESSGGSAHKNLAEIISQILSEAGVPWDKIDILNSPCTFSNQIGEHFAEMWNNSQKNGEIKKQMIFFNLIELSSFLFYVPSYNYILKLLNPEDGVSFGEYPDRVILTSPMFIPGICDAVIETNKNRTQNNFPPITIDLYMTELPADNNPFYVNLKILNSTQASIITLYSMPPLESDVKTYGSVNNYWKEKTGHDLKIINKCLVKKGYLSEELNSPSNHLPKPHTSVEIKLKAQNQKEKSYVLSHTDIFNLETTNNEITYKIPVNENDQVGLIMLGSVPTAKTIFDYVEQAKKYKMRRNDNKEKTYLFIACGNKDLDLYAKVVGSIGNGNGKGKSDKLIDSNNFIIIPFTGQDVQYIFARADFTITRSGGMTSQEILLLKKRSGDDKKIFIHGETNHNGSPNYYSHQLLAKKIIKGEVGFGFEVGGEFSRKNLEQEELIKTYDQYIYEGMPIWEAGNSHYLHDQVGAKNITPELFPIVQDKTSPIIYDPALLKKILRKESNKKNQWIYFKIFLQFLLIITFLCIFCISTISHHTTFQNVKQNIFSSDTFSSNNFFIEFFRKERARW